MSALPRGVDRCQTNLGTSTHFHLTSRFDGELYSIGGNRLLMNRSEKHPAENRLPLRVRHWGVCCIITSPERGTIVIVAHHSRVVEHIPSTHPLRHNASG